MAFLTKFTRKSGDFYIFNAKDLAFFGVNFILQKFCSCKKNDKYQVWGRLHVLMFHDFTMIIIFAVSWSSAILPYLLLLMMRVWIVSILDSSKCNEIIVSQSPCSFRFDVIIKDCCPLAPYFSCWILKSTRWCLLETSLVSRKFYTQGDVPIIKMEI